MSDRALRAAAFLAGLLVALPASAGQIAISDSLAANADALNVSSVLTAEAPEPPVPAGPGLAWKLGLDRPVRWFKASPSGVFLVGTDRDIVGVAPDSGRVLWRIGPIEDSHSRDVELLEDRAEAILSAGVQDPPGFPPLSLIDLRDGHTLWSHPSGGRLKSFGSFLVPGTSHVLLRATTSPDGSTKTAMLVDLASGVPIWTNPSLADELQPDLVFWSGPCRIRAHQVPFMDSDSSMIFHIRDGTFRKFDLNTGAPLWNAEGKHVEPYASATDDKHRASLAAIQVAHQTFYNSKTGKVETDFTRELEEDKEREAELQLAPMLRSSSGARFYAPYQRSVAAFSLVNGELLWSDPPRLDGVVAQMEETAAGLLVRTVEPSVDELHQRVLLLDPESGAVRGRWPQKRGRFIPRGLNLEFWKNATNFLVEEDRVVIAADGQLLTADLAQLRGKSLGKLRFDDSDDARTLLSVPGGYAVIGRSNLGIYAKADGQRTKKYFREPPIGFDWGLPLLALSAVTRGWVPAKIGLEWPRNDLSESRERESYAYFLARMKSGGDEGRGIVRVRQETGDPAGEVYFGTKTPTYSLDSDGRIYFLYDSKTIQCHRF